MQKTDETMEAEGEASRSVGMSANKSPATPAVWTTTVRAVHCSLSHSRDRFRISPWHSWVGGASVTSEAGEVDCVSLGFLGSGCAESLWFVPVRPQYAMDLAQQRRSCRVYRAVHGVPVEAISRRTALAWLDNFGVPPEPARREQAFCRPRR